MYAAIWRLLPGPRPVKAFLAVLLLLAVVAALFLWVFPAVAPYLPFNDNTVGSGSAAAVHTVGVLSRA